jgi:deoxyuridine 5'-triphosphate nucleotidohydrolase
MKVKFKKLNENAVMPKKAHDDDFCYDVVATSCEEIAPNVYKYGTGLALQIGEQGKHNAKSIGSVACFDARPRSSVWKTGMVLSNCIGTIDEGYTGEITAVFYHVMPNMPKYEVGDRIFQLCINLTDREIVFEEVDEFEKTDRGDGGYGSTGK